jgi:hypothetical protein
LLFTRKVLAVAIAYGALLGGFAGKLGAFKAEFDAFGVGAVADSAELIFACYAAEFSVWAFALLHFGAFFTCDSADTDFHFMHQPKF